MTVSTIERLRVSNWSASAHQLVLHVAPRLCKEVKVEPFKQVLGQLLRDVASVSKNFAAQAAKQIDHGLTVIRVARSECNIEQIPLFADD